LILSYFADHLRFACWLGWLGLPAPATPMPAIERPPPPVSAFDGVDDTAFCRGFAVPYVEPIRPFGLTWRDMPFLPPSVGFLFPVVTLPDDLIF